MEVGDKLKLSRSLWVDPCKYNLVAQHGFDKRLDKHKLDSGHKGVG